jgi:hypothetical protein
MGAGAGGLARRKEPLQVVLDLVGCRVLASGLLRGPFAHPTPDPLGQRFPDPYPSHDLVGEGGIGRNLGEASKLRIQELPTLHFAPTVGAGIQMLLDNGFLLGRKPLIQEFLNLLRGQMPHVTVKSHRSKLLSFACGPLRELTA